jgi:uncharacterized coiled-coil protein SlyX
MAKKPKKRTKVAALVPVVARPAASPLEERVVALERKIGTLVADQDREIAKLRTALAEMTKDRDTWRMKCEHLQGQLSQRLLNPYAGYYYR